ncbi:MAG: polymerase subunit delta, partial [Pseudonocardiales bacterium]|nr:polymerase subunit delta [Pseudonocardiales bacterium]
MSVWDSLVGQADAIAVLRPAAESAHAIADDRALPPAAAAAMTHAWLFTGPPGAGRSVAARAFAAALLGERAVDLGCGECPACGT